MPNGIAAQQFKCPVIAMLDQNAVMRDTVYCQIFGYRHAPLVKPRMQYIAHLQWIARRWVFFKKLNFSIRYHQLKLLFQA